MKIILLERIEKLGNLGDVVNVKDGYARNYLLPQGKALRATEENLARFEREREEIERRNAEARAAAERQAEKIRGAMLAMIRAAGETGHLYGSVTTRDIANALKEKFGVEVPRSAILLERPIKMIGLHDVKVRLHGEVTETVTLNVARNEEEAELQAKGEILIGEAEEAPSEVEQVLTRLEEEEGAEAPAAGGEEAEAETEAGTEAEATGSGEIAGTPERGEQPAES